MIVLMKMKKIILKHLLKPLLIPKENGMGILVIVMKTIILDLKICDYCSKLLLFYLPTLQYLFLLFKIEDFTV
jgi:hypothetical protein